MIKFDEIHLLAGSKKITRINDKILSQLRIDFIQDLVKELSRDPKSKKFVQIFFLMKWLSNKKINKLLIKYKSEKFRFGRGIVFHVCPSNMPLNFFYSFIFGFLSGNSNIVKVSSKKYQEEIIVINALKKVFFKKKYNVFKKTNLFVKYNNQKKINDYYSNICDIRIVWGGDETINKIRESFISPKSYDVTFPDRYSFSIINLNFLKNKSRKYLLKIANNFFYDSYTLNQNACNSPHIVFWLGKEKKIIDVFWNLLSSIVEQNNFLDYKPILEKFDFILQKINQLNIKNIIKYKNNIYVAKNFSSKRLENIRGINGIFFQKEIVHLSQIQNYVDKKCQTISYIGFKKKDFVAMLDHKHFEGIDRIVPVGKSLEISFDWDGYDLIRTLSRTITIE